MEMTLIISFDIKICVDLRLAFWQTFYPVNKIHNQILNQFIISLVTSILYNKVIYKISR